MDPRVVYIGTQCMIGALFIVLYYLNRVNRRGQRPDKLDAIYYLFFITIVLDSIWIMIDGVPEYRTWHVLLQIVYLSTMAFTGYIWFLHTLDLFPAKSFAIRKYRFILGIPVLIELAFILTSESTGWIFKVTQEGVYIRGDYHLLTIILNYIYMLLGSFVAYKCSKEAWLTMDKKRFQVAAFFPLPAIILASVQMAAPPGLPTMQGGVLVSLLMLYGTSQNVLITRDYLTDLPNRVAFERSLIKLTQSHREGASGHLYLIEGDLDHFKEINDTHGHPEGDRVLRLTSKALGEFFAPYKGNVFRTGGDEFMVILESEDEPDIKEMRRALNEKLAQLDQLGDISVSMSLGMREYDDSSDFRDLIKIVDKDLYAEKTR